MHDFYKRSGELIKKIMGDKITLYSAQASFYIIISVFPFIMLLMSVMGYFVNIPEQAILRNVEAFLPDAVIPAVSEMANELFGKSIKVASVTAIVALWSASRGIAAVERGIREVYSTPSRRIFIADYAASIVYTLIFMATVFLTLAIQVFGNVIISFAEKYIVFTSTEIILIKGVLFFTLMCLIFQLMYYLFDSRRKHFGFHLPGAAFSAVGWMVFSNIYSLYIDNFANYSFIYGSLTAVVLLMLWLYFCVMILLLGAEINEAVNRR